tara:strand:+ start:353 stop:520 length:168 start_codon:yes stop_codon:yes gene_type:complete
MKNVLFAVVSLILPGGGQLLQGDFWAALGWLIIAFVLPGIGNIGSAIHALIGASK